MKNASNSIQESIAGVIIRSEKTSEAMTQVYGEIISGIDSVNQTTVAITGMVGDVKTSIENISEITSATEDQAVAPYNVTRGISNIMGIEMTGFIFQANEATKQIESIIGFTRKYEDFGTTNEQ